MVYSLETGFAVVASCHTDLPPSSAPIGINDKKKCPLRYLFVYKESEICAKV